jgi:hypothetical protein
VSERYAFIDAEKDTMTKTGERKYTISKMCQWLEVSTSGYYEWRDRPESDTAKRRAYLAVLVSQEFYSKPSVIEKKNKPRAASYACRWVW